jgi:hypothetical protein
MVTLHLVPADITESYVVHEWRNAAGVLAAAHPKEWADVLGALREFQFLRSDLLRGGSVIARRFDDPWPQRDGVRRVSPQRSVSIMTNEIPPLTRSIASKVASALKLNGTIKTHFSIET